MTRTVDAVHDDRPAEARPMEANLRAILDERGRRRERGPGDRTGLTPTTATERLIAFLCTQLHGAFEVADVRQLSGGGANEGYAFTLVYGGERERLVLRIKSHGACCETDVEREFSMLGAVRSILPVPEPRWLTLDPEHFGAPAMVTEFVSGVPAPTDAVPLATGLGTVYGPRLAAELAPQFVGHLAALHRPPGPRPSPTGPGSPSRRCTPGSTPSCAPG
ncbi:phosphotransferase [Pseudonocardia sp. NPDC049154]|uniref:phosphotransferase n=1 Tax=Pseudonocardia sp. NPDC049154 TaxID=3155501 RepID=UPI0033E27672